MPLPFAPRRIVIGANAHAPLSAAIAARRPDLSLRGGTLAEITADDLAWGDTFVGFRRPPAAASLGAIRWVHCTGAGVDAWMAPEEISREILLTRTPESFGPMIAEWVASRVLAFQQELAAVTRDQQAGRWVHREVAMVAGTRALVLGTGDVGRAVARMLASLGCVVTGVSRTGGAADPAFSAVHQVSALPTLVGEADWIVVTLPLTPATKGLVDRALLSACRGAVLLNAGRGAVVDESALPAALDAGWLRGAALDVFAVEPLPHSSPLWGDARVMVSAHISGPTTIAGAANGFLECLAALEAGQLPTWIVDRERGY